MARVNHSDNPTLVPVFCINNFSHCCKQNQNKPNSLREETFILAHGSRGFLFHVGEGRADALGLWWWEHWAGASSYSHRVVSEWSCRVWDRSKSNFQRPPLCSLTASNQAHFPKVPQLLYAFQCIILSVSILQGEDRDLQTTPILDSNTDCSYYSPVMREQQVWMYEN